MMPPLRKGDCPDRSARQGQRAKHNWVSKRPRCQHCPKEEPYRNVERCERKHETFAYCNFCGVEDKTRHYCDVHVMSVFHSKPCDRRAVGDEPVRVPNPRNSSFTTYPDEWRYVCFQHHPDSVTKRREEFEAKIQADRERRDAQLELAHDRSEAFDLLVEVAGWIANNRELVETDEWLADIAGRIAGNDTVMKKLDKAKLRPLDRALASVGRVSTADRG